ncbi:MAG: substrate-binding domain-containing protein [Chloroflexi bacterium]|nr:substrate-binding domain-containing protein [Chloroflexota bacterium]
MRKVFALTVVISLAVGILITACSSSPPPTPIAPPTTTKESTLKQSWQQEWESVVAGAKKEGAVSIASNWGPKPRQAIIDIMQQKFGLDAEISSAGASQQGEKLLTERRAGIFSYDIAVQGANFGVNLMKPSGAFDPADQALILPEVKDPKVWLGGQFPWFDKAHTMIPFFARLDTNLSINTSLVKPGEITAYKDLLDPRWKGQILLRDPTTVGAGSGWFRENGRDLGLDFMRALARQEPAILDNDRQCVEWLARGKYSVLIAGNSDQLNNFIKEGATISILDAKDSRTLGPSSGIVSLVNRPPHPNAARLFLNWILTSEGQTTMTRNVGLPSRRLDAPTDHIVSVLIPQQGRKYTEYTEEGVAGDAEALTLSREVFGRLLGK